ncbi:MAG: ribonuclease HII [Erysipelotrichales bacterium]|nr:ribonuclease HII [Erysipelotrichales bacterium]
MQAGNENELVFWNKNQLCIGLDEAGRGPIAGPVVVAGVVLPINFSYDGIYDSKKISEKKRKELYKVIIENALDYVICIVDRSEIDKGNIYQVVKKAMKDCVLTSSINMSGVLTDAMPMDIDGKEVISLIKGDQKSISIAAASILAKVTRDQIMEIYDEIYPGYEFKKHKGYYTKLHKECIEKNGPCPIHRTTFEPIKSMLQPTLF